jgi:hypothetical protein
MEGEVTEFFGANSPCGKQQCTGVYEQKRPLLEVRLVRRIWNHAAAQNLVNLQVGTKCPAGVGEK